MKAERVSYDIMTPSAARGILEAIYWKPEISFVVDRIHVLKTVQFTSVRRNEVSDKAVNPSFAAIKGQDVNAMGIFIEEKRRQRASLILRDVAYVIEAHFDVLGCRMDKDGPVLAEADCAAKHISIFNRRARSGQAFQQPYLGCREFPAHFALIEDDNFPPSSLDESERNHNYGFILHDFIFTEDPKGKIIESNTGKKLTAHARFFRAKMENGAVAIPNIYSEEVFS